MKAGGYQGSIVQIVCAVARMVRPTYPPALRWVRLLHCILLKAPVLPRSCLQNPSSALKEMFIEKNPEHEVNLILKASSALRRKEHWQYILPGSSCSDPGPAYEVGLSVRAQQVILASTNLKKILHRLADRWPRTCALKAFKCLCD